jgi:CRP-like cAMP-binding protein
MARAIIRRQWSRGERVFRAGNPCPALVYLSHGAIRSYTINDRHQEVTYFLFFEGALVVDYRSLITGEASRFDFEVMQDAQGEWVSARNLTVLVARFPELQKAARLFSDQAYIALDRRAESLLLDSPEARYLRFIEEFGDQVDRIPQHVLSTWLGVRPESLSRIRKRLKLHRSQALGQIRDLNAPP